MNSTEKKSDLCQQLIDFDNERLQFARSLSITVNEDMPDDIKYDVSKINSRIQEYIELIQRNQKTMMDELSKKGK